MYKHELDYRTLGGGGSDGGGWFGICSTIYCLVSLTPFVFVRIGVVELTSSFNGLSQACRRPEPKIL